MRKTLWIAYPVFLLVVLVVVPEAICRLDGKYTAHREAVRHRRQNPFERSWLDLDTPRPKADPETVRIVAIGDSFTHGVTLGLDQTWPKVLEGLLAARTPAGGPAYEVLNAGVGGANLMQETDNIERAVAHLEPDLILHQIFLNDFYLVQKYEECGEFEVVNRVLRAPEFRLHLEYYLWSAWRTLRHGNAFKSFIVCQGDLARPHWQRLAKLFRRNQKLLDEHGVGYLVFLVPHMNWRDRQYPFVDFHDSVRRTVSPEVEHYEDLLPRLMEQFGSAYDDWLDPSLPDAHPNAEIHRAYAALVLEILKRDGFVAAG
jgi:GDSL-like Lipase/Acylhydrolase family